MAAWLPPVAACAGGGCLASAVQPELAVCPGLALPGLDRRDHRGLRHRRGRMEGQHGLDRGPGPLRRAGEVRPASWRTVSVYRI